MNRCCDSLRPRRNVHLNIDSIARGIGSNLKRVLSDIERHLFRPTSRITFGFDRLTKFDHAFEEIVRSRIDAVSRVAVDIFRLKVRLNWAGAERHGFHNFRCPSGQELGGDAIRQSEPQRSVATKIVRANCALRFARIAGPYRKGHRKLWKPWRSAPAQFSR